MSERDCPPWCIERHPADAGPDEADREVWLHRSSPTQIDTHRDRAVLRSEWTSHVTEVYLATVDDPNHDISYQTVIEVAHGGVLLTLTAGEARKLASVLYQCANRVDRSRARLRLRPRPGRRRAG